MSLIVFAGVALAACGGDSPAEPLGRNLDGIINGQVDNGHHAVVAVLSNSGVCTGTIIHTDPAQGIGHVLTAAHCGAPLEVRGGTDYTSPGVVYNVVDWQNHPNYDSQSNLFDFKMVRFIGASAATPIIAAMTPAQDNLGANTQVRHVGYGKAGPAPGSDNSQRRQILGALDSASSVQLFYNQPNGGPCSGDSGGPQLTVGTERVAGVTSYGDATCGSYGVSGRVSGVYDSFIIPYINNAPSGPLTCDQCYQLATGGEGACVPQVNNCFNDTECSDMLGCFNACSTNSCIQGCIDSYPNGWVIYETINACVCNVGCPMQCGDEPLCDQGGSSVAASSSSVGSGGATVGSGSSGSGDTTTGGDGNWSSGDIEDEDYRGTAFTSSCSAPAGFGRGGSWWAVLGLAGLGLARRRRRQRGA